MKESSQEKPCVPVTRKLPEVILEEFKRQVDVEIWDKETPIPYDTLLEKVRGKQGLVCLLSDKVDARVVDAGTDLKVISQIAVGFDNIDVAAASARGIRVNFI